MWLFIGICVAVIAGLCLLINLIPRRFFDAPLCTAKVAGPPPPLKTTSLRDANEIAFVQQTHKYLAFRLRTIMIRFNTEARLLTPGALKNAGIDPEKMKIVIELSETIIHERNNDDFTNDLPPIFSPGIMRLSPALDRSHSLSQRRLEILGRVGPFFRC
jgi:hypothetical protein